MSCHPIIFLKYISKLIVIINQVILYHDLCNYKIVWFTIYCLVQNIIAIDWKALQFSTNAKHRFSHGIIKSVY